MASDFPLRSSLGSLQERLLSSFREATAEIEHRGAKGREREALIAQEYLQGYVPTLEVVHGAEIVDSTGARSAECDLVVQDPTTPPLLIGRSFHLVPVEWAHGIVEVKSTLDGRELKDAHQKIQRAKSLKKLTYVPQTGDIRHTLSAYGKTFDHFPMYGFVFAYTGIGLPELARQLWDLQRDQPMTTWVDAVVVLDQGVLFYSDAQGGASVRPSPGCTLQAIVSDVPLLAATLMLQTAFNGIRMQPANLRPYLGPGAWGSVAATVGVQPDR